MKNNVGIMGFGRIGRDALRIWALRENKEFNITHVAVRNVEKTLKERTHLFKFDSIYRTYPGEIEFTEDGMVVDGHKITFVESKTPEEMNWRELGVDVVIDSSGAFKDEEQAKGHIKAGAKKVVLTSPGKGDILTVVMGVNDDKYDAEKHDIISNASCTTNCLAPITKVVLDNFGIKKGLMSTVHAYTNDQNIHDAVHKKDMRRARMGAENIIPTSTGAAKAVGKVIPEVDGILTGFALRVPVPTGSLVDVTFELEKEATKEEINAAIKKASENELKGILEYSEDELVSSDIIGNKHSSIFDSLLTTVNGNMVKLISWYDNEWGYTERVIDLTEKIVKSL
ncbi:type I glyceraldehyde-3-phosphate dehydrogenase [Peptoniphilus sp. MSJ-1]|uniref:Type I glyceraldehyde-3-phosphate dehydrogenase n=1 Tax=Peptoniphilus ovalis TaxID=2841503 RepID=A0ABS6FI19_9FIRM|nr:type I glyceraldehyde-3-phosphate dehydrogenase [Peptoniphilus ovalis]MBU5669820.1 type I glyceraldehyde-3-phosphate dehydrogenase [Peptoniphilus ovalis]